MIEAWATLSAILGAACAGPRVTYTRVPNTDSSVRAFECGVATPCGTRPCKRPASQSEVLPECNITALAGRCAATPHCAGFNSNGWLKSCVSTQCGARLIHTPGTDTYVGSSTPPGPPPQPPSPDAPVRPVDDWHFPAEEDSERAALQVPLVLRVTATSNSSCSAELQIAGVVRRFVEIGAQSPEGWILVASIAPTTAVFEKNFARWGLYGFADAQRINQPLQLVRKGVGQTNMIRRPRYTLEEADPSYFTKARDAPNDYIKQRFLQESQFREAEFAAAASFLPPAKDYGEVGNIDSHTKFVVAPDARVRCANGSVYSPMFQGNITTDPSLPGALLFDPRQYLTWWPQTNHSEYKSAYVGRHSRAINVAGYDVSAGRGFSFLAVPNMVRGIETAPYDRAELLVQLVEYVGGAASEPMYFAVESPASAPPGGPWVPTTPRALHDGSLLFANLRAHVERWDRFFGSGLQVKLAYNSSEGQRLVDMSRAVIAGSMANYVGLRPNYGNGQNYWSVAQKDRGSLPLESYALVTSLLYWGQVNAAAERVEYYLFTYVRNASGITPLTHPGMEAVPGLPGSLDMKGWPSHNCSFADSLADYGRWLDLWVATARAQESHGASAWVTRTYVQIRLMTQYLLSLPSAAPSGPHPSLTKGLIYGPAEHDTCATEAFWFSTNTWSWRGLVELGRFLNDTDAVNDPSTASAVVAGSTGLHRSLAVAAAASIVNSSDGTPLFVPPFVTTNFTPYSSMIEHGGFGGGPAYSNFRYFSEMLSSGYFAPAVEVALSNFRETHTGTLSGMTRFRDHLDDMPAAGYALSSLTLDRIEPFLALLFGHMANYHSRGTYNAPEQMSLYGDGVDGLWTYADSYRARLGTGDIDVDFCVPSTTLPAYMTRLMLVFENRDENVLWLLKGAPRRFYLPNPSAIVISEASTRFGTIGLSLNVTGSGAFVGTLRWNLHGRGFVRGAAASDSLKVVIRLRDAANKHVVGQPAVKMGGCSEAARASQALPPREAIELFITDAKKGHRLSGLCTFTASLIK